jgi:hypothetical protein
VRLRRLLQARSTGAQRRHARGAAHFALPHLGGIVAVLLGAPDEAEKARQLASQPSLPRHTGWDHRQALQQKRSLFIHERPVIGGPKPGDQADRHGDVERATAQIGLSQVNAVCCHQQHNFDSRLLRVVREIVLVRVPPVSAELMWQLHPAYAWQGARKRSALRRHLCKGGSPASSYLHLKNML